jgi:hypothetical protein
MTIINAKYLQNNIITIGMKEIPFGNSMHSMMDNHLDIGIIAG